MANSYIVDGFILHKIRQQKKALECFEFVTKSATQLGFLSEQVDNKTMKPNWVIGLGWSHAMYIITLAEILKNSKKCYNINSFYRRYKIMSKNTKQEEYL